MPEYLYKVIVIGDNNVGKTSLLNRYVNNRYVDNCKSTVGVDFLLKVVHYDDSTLRMQFWDIAGQEYSKQLSRSYYKDANACIIVFDITKRTTFDSVIQWKEEVDQKLGQIPTLILSNKYDLIMDPQNPRISCIDDMDLDTLKDSIHATGCFQVICTSGEFHILRHNLSW